ncbi:MAG TPA: adenosine deaminase [Candidatus Cybelea sp.]|jgi:adenosine deaminase|nr:adenosine deaminase [Candidatus Cybelea sp.]
MTLGSLATRLPKIHLHCHLEGCLRPSTFVELADAHGVSLRYKSDDAGVDRSDPYALNGLGEFLYIFAAVSRSLQEPEDYARLAREFVEDALAEGVVYGELFVSPSVWTFFNPQLDVRATMEAIVTELRAARPQATFALLPDLTRNFGHENALATARTMATMTDLDVIGLSLGGDEARFPAKLFADVFAFARAEGLHCVAHAGEADGAQSVRDAIELLGAERIGHGIRALEDSHTVELLATRKTPLEICPTSNRRTGSELADYPEPYSDFDRAGCVVTIDCDDPAIFKTSIEREYAIVEAAAGRSALERFVRNAIAASFASPELKRGMERRVDAAVAELPARTGS